MVASGVLENGEEFKAYVGQNNVDPADFASGKFVILSQTKISTLVNGLLKGENGQGDLEVKVNVVFNRCKDIYDVAGSISKCIQADSISLIECFTSQDVLNKYGFTKLSFAGVLKDIVAILFGWDREMLEGSTIESREWREQIDPWWSEKLLISNLTPRYVLQFLGTDLFRNHFHPDIWVISVERQLSKYSIIPI